MKFDKVPGPFFCIKIIDLNFALLKKSNEFLYRKIYSTKRVNYDIFANYLNFVSFLWRGAGERCISSCFFGDFTKCLTGAFTHRRKNTKINIVRLLI